MASHSLQMGLVPISEALGNYTTETGNAYERLRFLDDNREGNVMSLSKLWLLSPGT